MLSLAQQFSDFAIKSIFGWRTMTMNEALKDQVFSPSPQDVLVVKKHLRERRQLPLELVDTIIDHAEYWPRTTTIRQSARDAQLSIRSGGPNENFFLLRSYPLGFTPAEDANADYQMTDQYQTTFPTLLPQPWPNDREVPRQSTEEVLNAWKSTSIPRTEHPCRKIVFTIVSHDQGWGGGGHQGKYEGSYTWFDVGKEEVSAFIEGSILEAWEKAPWPQFRLHHASQDNSKAAGKISVSEAHSPLVCSLRTTVPESILETSNRDPWGEGDSNSSSADEDSEIGEEGEDGGGGLVGPPDELNPGVQAPPGREQELQPERAPPKSGYTFKHDLCPEDNTLQKNVTASSELRTHTITWSYKDNTHPKSLKADQLSTIGRGKNTANGEYVRNLKVGDCVTVWGKARFAGWINYVEKVEIDVYWAI